MIGSPVGCRDDGEPEPGGASDSAARVDDHLEISPGALDGWNVLLVSIDTLRADHVGCYGYPRVETPVMDGLARRGVRFTQAIAPAPITLPSHASMLTGLTPQHHGARVNGLFELKPGPATLAELLTTRGYHSAAFLSSVVLDSRCGLDRGFAHYDDQWETASIVGRAPPNQRRAGPTSTAVLAWLEAHGHERFFLWVHYFDPHFPYDPPEPFASQYTAVRYDGEIAYADQQLGVLLQWLDEHPNGSKTLVIVTSDHGEGLGDHQEMTHSLLLHDATLHVPLIVSGPAPVPHGHIVTRLTGLVDLVPTILALVGEPIPAGLDGVSLLQPPGRNPRALYIETLGSKFFRGWAPLLGIRRADYKFVLAPKPELYDLGADPKELNNVYADRHDVAAELYDVLRKIVGGDPELIATVQGNLPLTLEALQQLRALGYVAPTSTPATGPDDQAGKAFADLPNPTDMIGYALLIHRARGLMERGEGDKAIEILEPYLEKSPRDARALLLLGKCYAARNRQPDALSCFERAVKCAGRSAHVPAAVGKIYLHKGKVDQAIACFQQALRMEPDHPTALQLLGRAYRIQGRDAEAMALLDRLTKVRNGAHVAIAQHEIGRLHQVRGRLEQAERAFRRALEICPVLSASAKALAEVEGKQADKQIVRLRGSVATRPTSDSLLTLGRLLRGRGKSAEAIPYLERALRGAPTDAEAHWQLGLALESTGRRQEGIGQLRRAIQLDPNSAEAHIGLGGALARSGRLPDGLRHFNRAAELDLDSPMARYNAGLVLAQQGHWDQAARKLRETLRLNPAFLKARIRLGQVLENLGQRDRAIACYRQVLEAEPKHKRAQALLRRARRHAPGAGPGVPESPPATALLY